MVKHVFDLRMQNTIIDCYDMKPNKGEGRSGSWVPLLPEKNLKFWGT